MADFKVINTQEEFDAAIKERLDRAGKKIREEYNGWTSPEGLKELTDKHQEEIQKLTEAHSKDLEKYAGYEERFTEQTNRIHELEISALKVRIATEMQLPLGAAEFLQGDDEKSIAESAEKLKKLSSAQQSQSRGHTRETETKEADGVLSAFQKLNPKIKI